MASTIDGETTQDLGLNITYYQLDRYQMETIQRAAHEAYSEAKENFTLDKRPVIEMLLWCPECGERHIDKGKHAKKPHHTHACQYCGMVWRPAILCTVGVQFLPGFKDAKNDKGDQRISIVETSSAHFSKMSNPNMDILERFKTMLNTDLTSLTLRDLNDLMDLVRIEAAGEAAATRAERGEDTRRFQMVKTKGDSAVMSLDNAALLNKFLLTNNVDSHNMTVRDVDMLLNSARKETADATVSALKAKELEITPLKLTALSELNARLLVKLSEQGDSKLPTLRIEDLGWLLNAARSEGETIASSNIFVQDDGRVMSKSNWELMDRYVRLHKELDLSKLTYKDLDRLLSMARQEGANGASLNAQAPTGQVTDAGLFNG